MTEINFLSSRTRHKQKQREQDKKLFKISSIVLIVVVSILVVIIGVKLVINLRIKDKNKTITSLKQTIVEKEAVELSYLIFVNKLKAVGEIYASRSDKQTAMNYFADLMSDVATITAMNYEEESGGLTLSLDHQNVFFLEKSTAILDSPQVKEAYKNVKRGSLTRADQGNYVLNLTIQLKTVEDLGLFDATPVEDEFDVNLDQEINNDLESESLIEELN
ncbi:MAG: hypothetical protein GX559_00735 [Candidatus Pacebacteria bacterium]|nr:hypothetical protein [Candidatus Paceibacterota bacterium]